MELNLTTQEQIDFLQGILDSKHAVLDSYERAVYKGIIKKLELLKQLIYNK